MIIALSWLPWGYAAPVQYPSIQYVEPVTIQQSARVEYYNPVPMTRRTFAAPIWNEAACST